MCISWKQQVTSALVMVCVGASLATSAPPAGGAHANVSAVPRRANSVALPAEKPAAQQASYWRQTQHAKRLAPPPPSSAAVVSDTPAGPRPPEPTPLAQPAWLLPDVVELVPVEPPGEAVFIDDTVDEPSVSEVFELAMASVELAPPRATALLVVARELAEDAATKGDFTDVIHQCHRALDAQPDRPTAAALADLAAWAYNRRGELVALDGDEHQAFEDFQEAIRLNPTCWQALHNRGVTLARYGKATEALADFDRVVELAPQFAIARYNRAEVLSQLDRWSAAVDDYTAALAAMPDEASWYAARGCARYQLGQTADAGADYNTAIRLDDSLAEAYLGRGNLYASERMYEQAAADFQQALRLDTRSAAAYRSVAWLLSTCPLEKYRSVDKGIEAARRAAKLLGHDRPEVLDTLAAAYANGGDFQRAITYEQQAIVLAGDAERAAYETRLGLYRQGRPFRTP